MGKNQYSALEDIRKTLSKGKTKLEKILKKLPPIKTVIDKFGSQTKLVEYILSKGYLQRRADFPIIINHNKEKSSEVIKEFGSGLFIGQCYMCGKILDVKRGINTGVSHGQCLKCRDKFIKDCNKK